MNEKKAPNWVLRVMLAFVALFVAVIVGVGVFVWRWASDPARQAAIKKSIASVSRPGTAEMRAAGCHIAMVQTGEELRELTNAMIGKKEKVTLETPSTTLVICRLDFTATKELSCEDIARAYASGAKDHPDAFYVQVNQQALPRERTICEGVYDAAGKLVQESSFSKAFGPEAEPKTAH